MNYLIQKGKRNFSSIGYIKSTAASLLNESCAGQSFGKGSFERLLHGPFNTKGLFRRIHPRRASHSTPLNSIQAIFIRGSVCQIFCKYDNLWILFFKGCVRLQLDSKGTDCLCTVLFQDLMKGKRVDFVSKNE